MHRNTIPPTVNVDDLKSDNIRVIGKEEFAWMVECTRQSSIFRTTDAFAFLFRGVAYATPAGEFSTFRELCEGVHAKASAAREVAKEEWAQALAEWGAEPETTEHDSEQQAGQEKPLIFVVDDEPDTRELISVILEKEGLAVMTAENGSDTLEVLARTLVVPRLVFLDRMMPVMSGFEVLELLRANRMFDETPIIFTAASFWQRDVERAKDLGADAFMPEPFRAEDLVRLVREKLDAP